MKTVKKRIFDKTKLPKYIPILGDKKVAIVGCGAVGSSLGEDLVKMGVKHVTCIDMDKLEEDNYSKSSGIYRFPEDVGENKAIALAKRLNGLLQDDSVLGFDESITRYGPKAFEGFDVIILALDNYASKLYSNQIWLQILPESRPLLISGGTIEECAQSDCLDGSKLCLRDTFDESWLEDPLVRTSCQGPQYRPEHDKSEFAITTGLASGVCANMIAEQVRAYCLGCRDMVNTKAIYSAYPEFKISKCKLLPRNDCPDCKNYYPPIEAIAISGFNVKQATIKELLEYVRGYVGTDDFEIGVPQIDFGHITYNKIIKDDFCRNCKKPIKNIYRHEFYTKYSDMLCDDCKDSKKKANDSLRADLVGTVMNSFTINELDRCYENKTLYDLGFAIGGFIQVTVRSEGLDVLDNGWKDLTFYCEDDRKMMSTKEE